MSDSSLSCRLVRHLSSQQEEFPTSGNDTLGEVNTIMHILIYERMQVFFERGNVIAFVGAPHVKEIKKMLLGDGYEVAQFS